MGKVVESKFVIDDVELSMEENNDIVCLSWKKKHKGVVASNRFLLYFFLSVVDC